MVWAVSAEATLRILLGTISIPGLHVTSHIGVPRMLTRKQDRPNGAHTGVPA